MTGRSNCTHEDHSNQFIIYIEFDKVISRACDTFGARFPKKQKESLNTIHEIIQNFKNFGSLRARDQKKKMDK